MPQFSDAVRGFSNPPKEGAGAVSKKGDIKHEAAINQEPKGSVQSKGASSKLDFNNRSIQMATYDYDKTCTQVVAPFDLMGGVGEALKLTAIDLGQSLSADQDKQATTHGQSSTKERQALKHHVPASVRGALLRLNWLPMRVETSYGQSLKSSYESDGLLIARDSSLGKRWYPTADAILSEILVGVDEAHPYQFEIVITTRSGTNAMALPGGVLLVDKSLVSDARNKDKAYFAIAHEISHVLQRHETRQLQARIIDAYSISSDLVELRRQLKASGDAANDAMAILQILAKTKAQFGQHYEEQELQADACATRLLSKGLGNDERVTRALQAFVSGLPKVEPKQTVFQFLESDLITAKGKDLVFLVNKPMDRHPATQMRVEKLNFMMRAIRSSRPAAVPIVPAVKPQRP